ncbi:MAG: hypothetical protein H7Z71_12370 [Moraxellaceae bacterium]|nr:hypothetical protein [Pseudobdellovibrionaceae bacterium]
MAINPLPPQAYTKETLQKAYSWLLNQNPSIKEMASTQEMLVSLYLKAQRNGEASLEAPSIQNFKQELKSLATMMGDFTPPTASLPSPAVTAKATSVMPSTFNELDTASLTAISEVKTVLNLGSDTEALRALIALGHKQFRKIN